MEPRDDLPNVVIILSDQLRRQALSVYGDGDARTPHVEALARDGVRFTHACATSPICVPFRFTFMTGEYAHSRKVPGIEYVMSPAERTLADEFNEAGYETVYIGKWHLDGGAWTPGFGGAGQPDAGAAVAAGAVADVAGIRVAE